MVAVRLHCPVGEYSEEQLLDKADEENRVSIAATWDTEVVKELGQIIISEAKSKEVDVVLGPTSRLFFPCHSSK